MCTVNNQDSVSCQILKLPLILIFFFLDHINGYIEFNDEPFDSSRLRNRPDVKKLGKYMYEEL